MSEAVAKFGGTSAADMEQTAHAIGVINQDTALDTVVVSAPGKDRDPDGYQRKVTDLLTDAYNHGRVDADLESIAIDRCYEVAERALGPCRAVGKLVAQFELSLNTAAEYRNEARYLASGEQFSARLLAQVIDGYYVDAFDIIKFSDNSRSGHSQLDLKKSRAAIDALGPFKDEGVIKIIPGFYFDNNGEFSVFPRGGSDISGAIVTDLLNRLLYINGTDVDGFYSTRPKKEGDKDKDKDIARHIPYLTYEEARAFYFAGAEILHGACIPYLTGIETRVMDTFNPDKPGTLVTGTRTLSEDELIVGILSRIGIQGTVRAWGLNERVGEFEKLTHAFREAEISLEHTPSGKDSMTGISWYANTGDLKAARAQFKEVLASLNSDYKKKVGLVGAVTLVGAGLRNQSRNAKAYATTYQALADHGIGLRGSEGFDSVTHEVFLNVRNVDKTALVLHNAFFPVQPKAQS